MKNCHFCHEPVGEPDNSEHEDHNAMVDHITDEHGYFSELATGDISAELAGQVESLHVAKKVKGGATDD